MPEGPLHYKITHETYASHAAQPCTGKKCGELNPGDKVRVMGMLHTEDGKLRGRLEHPPGWITLLDTTTGQRYAVREGVPTDNP
eukprot:CAMPEP_0172910934 /NCGR_PEP_ID=MMETSP1075-20121228/185564_1 /TAXON_ID=2916 /ORGANISM="Ceratium fusus, Strain PA161109" /LENGTH=83 /DNA_ID=CAMNT_0013769151 /DNA_START=75 /DNA_END=323 /DNA_ORIENTATION=-